jgi:hypothetical protein
VPANGSDELHLVKHVKEDTGRYESTCNCRGRLAHVIFRHMILNCLGVQLKSKVTIIEPFLPLPVMYRSAIGTCCRSNLLPGQYNYMRTVRPNSQNTHSADLLCCFGFSGAAELIACSQQAVKWFPRYQPKACVLLLFPEYQQLQTCKCYVVSTLDLAHTYRVA